MTKTARILFCLFGIVMPVFIGVLHLYVHFADLITSEVQQHLSSELIISGQAQSYWNAWGVMSVMMGMAFITIGFLNFNTFRHLSAQATPPVGAIIAMLFYLFGVIYVGHQFDAAFQFYGGIAGVLMATTCLFLSRKGNE